VCVCVCVCVYVCLACTSRTRLVHVQIMFPIGNSLQNSCFQLGHNVAQDVKEAALVGTGERPQRLKEEMEAPSLQEQLLGFRWVKL